MSWKIITVISFSLLLFLVQPQRVYAQGLSSNNTYYTNPRGNQTTNYYPSKKLSYQETEGLLNAGAGLIAAGFLYLEPEAVAIFWRALRRLYDVLGSEELFQLINRLL